MKTTTKVITFDFEFQYSLRGQFAQDSAITIAEPSYDKQAVFHKMRALTMLATKGILDWRSKQPVVKDEPVTDDKATESQATEINALNTLRFGLSPDAYIEFVDYVQLVLKRAPTLAWVGANPDQVMQDRIALNDETLKSIGERGSMDAIEEIVSEFAGFFLRDRTSKTASLATDLTPGSPSSFEPLATATEASPTSRRPRGGR